MGEKISWHSSQALSDILTERYNYNFDPSLFKSFTKGQYHLRKVVTTLFPDEGKLLFIHQTNATVILDDYLHPDLKYEHGESMQLDIYLPALQLAFEYQGAQHYQEVTMFKPLKIQKVRIILSEILIRRNTINKKLTGVDNTELPLLLFPTGGTYNAKAWPLLSIRYRQDSFLRIKNFPSLVRIFLHLSIPAIQSLQNLSQNCVQRTIIFREILKKVPLYINIFHTS